MHQQNMPLCSGKTIPSLWRFLFLLLLCHESLPLHDTCYCPAARKPWSPWPLPSVMLCLNHCGDSHKIYTLAVGGSPVSSVMESLMSRGWKKGGPPPDVVVQSLACQSVCPGVIWFLASKFVCQLRWYQAMRVRVWLTKHVHTTWPYGRGVRMLKGGGREEESVDRQYQWKYT